MKSVYHKPKTFSDKILETIRNIIDPKNPKNKKKPNSKIDKYLKKIRKY